MNKRPKRTDTEDDILEMQKAFLNEKYKNQSFQPAAQVVKLEKPKKQSLFAQSRNSKPPSDNVPEDKPTTNIILGDIIEKTSATPGRVASVDSQPDSTLGFPKAERIVATKGAETSKKSLFALSLERKRHHQSSSKEAEPSVSSLQNSLGQFSVIVDEQETGMSVHEENLKVLAEMKEQEILAERTKLLESLDPKLVKFLEEKRKQKLNQKLPPRALGSVKEDESSPMDVDTSLSVILDVPPVADIVNQGAAEKWVHFDVIEKDKLEWMKEVPAKIANLKPGENFEARFDWKGVLLPYTDEDDQRDTRELYMHGDEPFRPGYTLQELFRLARSNVIQQRVSAFGSIAGILNIYNQGFYDNVLELPISKIFFLLRFGFDENSIALLEVVSKGLSLLFYNDTDETILDLISETSEGYLQPIMEIENSEDFSEKDASENLEKHLKSMKLTSSPFPVNVQENEEESKTSMNDFQLAETDLIECFLRTNIIQRISYVLGTVQPENSTVTSCLKILIRIARTNKDCAVQIASNEELLNILITNFLPGLQKIGAKTDTSFYGFPQHLVLKLFRILISQHISLCIKLLNMDLVDHIRSYLFTREDMKAKLVKVQIESLRVVRAIMLIKPDPALYRELLPAFRYMLEWHYQNVIYEKGGPFLIRQHAAALLGAVTSGPVSDAKYILGESLAICSCKWFHEAAKHGIQEFSQSILLSSTLSCVSWYLPSNIDPFKEFIEKYLRQFINSKAFLDFQQNLSRSSILLKKTKDRRNIHPPLPNLGTIISEEESPRLIIPQTYPVFFLNSLFKVIEVLVKQNDRYLVNNLIQNETIESMTDFINKLSVYTNRNLGTNFLAKSELKLAFKLLCFDNIQVLLTKEVCLQATFNVLKCMTSEHIREIEILFETIVFNAQNLNFNQSILTNWKQIYLETFVYPQSVVIAPTDLNLALPCSNASILPFDWPYVLLKSLLNKYLQQMSDSKVITKDSDFPEHEVIRITLTFAGLLESRGLQIVSPTEKLMYLMIAFMGPDSQFLEPQMKSLLKDHVELFFTRYKDYDFKFDKMFEGKSKFENLYVLFLDHFQAASYGDNLFSSLVMVPLAQKYDSKWRKIVWSEHASVLRFLNCEENQLLGTLEAYLNPCEKDISLIKCYVQALNSNLLRVSTIPYKIAIHHVNNYTSTTSSRKCGTTLKT